MRLSSANPLFIAAVTSVGLVPAGCGTPDEAEAEPAARSVSAADLEALAARDAERSALAVDPAAAELRPNVLLSPGEAFEALQLDFDTLVRITTKGTDGREVTLAEFDSNRPQLLLISRDVGIKLGGDIVRRGPLDDDAEYAIYLLPQGGVRNEVMRTRRRPATLEELEAARRERKAERTAEREAEPDAAEGDRPGGDD